jgi:hypothetical protein
VDWYCRDGRTDSRRDGATLNGVPIEAIGFAKELLESAAKNLIFLHVHETPAPSLRSG